MVHEETSSGLNDALRFDQQRLEINLRHVQHCVAVQGAVAACGLWLHFYSELVAHFEAEDSLIPAYRSADAESAAVLEHEHRILRSLADDLTTDFNQGMATERALARFAELFAAHARWEEATLYPWSEHGVGEEQSRAVIERIQAAGVDRPHQEYLP
jgi:hemerythrin-like domain-containing protein